MNAGMVIKQLEDVIRKRHRIKGGFKVNFVYENYCILFSIIDKNKKRITAVPEKLCQVDDERRIILHLPLNIHFLFKQHVQQNNLTLESQSREDIGQMLLNSINYFYRRHAKIPTVLYGVD